MARASVIGSGPNGLAAAILLAEKGLEVDVYEAELQPGGAVRTVEWTLPGFRHDFGAAVLPLAVGSPFFRSFPWTKHGVLWRHSGANTVHPTDDDGAVRMYGEMRRQVEELGADGLAWRAAVGEISERWDEFSEDALGPPLHLPRSPWLTAKFASRGVLSAGRFVKRFKLERTKAMFAGLAAHAGMGLDEPLSASIGMVLAAAGHAVGWPVPQGGAQAVTDALIARLTELGGRLHCGHRVQSLDEVMRDGDVVMCDVTPRGLLKLGGSRLSVAYRRKLERFEYGPGAFKIDFALSEPIPWRAAECSEAITVHLGGTFAEIAHAEAEVRSGRVAERPYVLLAQPSLFDATRAPKGKHTAWAYCHVPNGCDVDVSATIEAQIERFAPGFKDCVLAKRASGPGALQRMDENLVGGDVNMGRMSVRQFVMRPSLDAYRTGLKGVYLCSASTPPGGGVHGMCGVHAARAALRDLRMD